jgi:hypothetical protein
MKLKFTVTSSRDKVQTISTSQFGDRNFYYGDKYRVYFDNGTSAIALVNRQNGSSLAINQDSLPKGFKLAKIGQPVYRTIKQLKKIS